MQNDLTVKQQQIQYVLSQFKITGFANAAVVTVSALLFLQEYPRELVLMWVGFAYACLIIRPFVFAQCQRRQANDPSSQSIQGAIIVFSVLSGLIWGIAAQLFLHLPLNESFFIVVILCTVLIGGVMPAMSAYWPAYVVFAVPTLLSTSEQFFSLGFHTTGVLVLVYLVGMLAISFRLGKVITLSITADLENAILLKEVTHLKELSEKANQDKSRFLASASHDLRQPLHAMGMFISVLGSIAVDARMKSIVSNISSTHNTLSDLLNALLEISRLDSGIVVPHQVDVVISDILAPVVTEYQPIAEEKGLIFKQNILFERDQCVDIVVKTDPVLLGRVIRNLVDNAIKFTSVGSITFKVELRNDVALVSISDTGIGIPEDEQENIFDEYYQLNNPARNREQGIGLGLAAVKKMVALLGYNLQLQSSPNKGSTLSVSIPLGDALLVEQSTDLVESEVLMDYKVLIVDNEESIRQATALQLEQWGCQSYIAESLSAAIAKIDQYQMLPDCIICDYRLGELDNGLTVTAALEAHCGKSLPAILMTGDTAPELYKQAREQGLILLNKPIKAGQLRQAMLALLD